MVPLTGGEPAGGTLDGGELDGSPLAGGAWNAALFDLDGTLVDSEPASQAAFCAYFASRGWDVEPEVYRQFAGRRAVDVFAQLAGPWQGEDANSLLAGVIAHLDHEANPPRPVPGAVELIRLLHAHDVPIALVTSANRAWAEYAVGDLLNVRDCFTAIVSWEDTDAGKPDPAPYRAGVAALNVDAMKAVAFEDTVAGIHSALAAGIGRVIGVSTGIDERALRGGGAHDVVASLAELT